jgi:hypothetical protein
MFEMPLGSGIECTRFWVSTSLSWPLTAPHQIFSVRFGVPGLEYVPAGDTPRMTGRE